MNISRTRDKKVILKVIRHPKVWRWVTDDMTPDNYSPLIHEALIYLTDEHKRGIIRLDPMNGVCCQVHISARPEIWGHTVEFGEAAKAWLFSNTRYQKVVAMIPEYNRLAVRLIKKLGFRQEGVIEKSFLKDWKLHNQIIFGLSKQ